MEQLQITLIPCGDNYIYLLSHDERACVIDPAEATPVFNELKKQKLTLEQIWITHHHSDHVLGVLPLKEQTNCTVTGPNDPRVPGLDRKVDEGETVSFGPATFEVLSVPGHTSTHIAYFSQGEASLFCGDCLFLGGCGRLFEGTPEEMLASLEKLKKLPDNTLVYCGHEYTENNLKFALTVEPNNRDLIERLQEVSSLRYRGKPTIPAPLSIEKKTNPFLRADQLSIKQTLHMEQASKQEVFAKIRSLKDQF